MNVDTGEIRQASALTAQERESGAWVPVRGPAKVAAAAAAFSLAAGYNGRAYAPATGPLTEFRAREQRKAAKRKRAMQKASKRRNRR